MHPMSFTFKRGHLTAVSVGRKILRTIGAMTPARFDVLFALHNAPTGKVVAAHGYRLPQNELRRRLGLSPSTVSKMLKLLRGLRLVTVARDTEYDRRTNIVALTDEGLLRIRLAFKEVFVGGELARRYWSFIEGQLPRGRKRGRQWRTLDALDELLWNLFTLTQHLGNRSDRLYRLAYEPDH